MSKFENKIARLRLDLRECCMNGFNMNYIYTDEDDYKIFFKETREIAHMISFLEERYNRLDGYSDSYRANKMVYLNEEYKNIKSKIVTLDSILKSNEDIHTEHNKKVINMIKNSVNN